MAKIKDLIPDDKNFNKGSEFGNSLIEKSFRKFGAGRSILIDKNNRIIAGNKSVENAAAIGFEDVQIIESDGTKIIAVKRTDIDLDSPEGREMALADNATAKANIIFDAELIDAEVGEVVCEEWGVELEKDAPQAEEDDYEMPDEIETDIVLGDLFEIGPHRLLCGDSTDSDSVARLMDGKKADMVFTDPDFSMPFDLLFEAYSNALIFSNGFGFWVCGDKQAVQLAMNDFENFSHFFIQDFRQATMTSGTQAMTRHVMICKFGNRPMNNLKDGFRTILEIATLRTTKDHQRLPMAKRIELPAAFIEHYTAEDEIVLDLFGHSGSTMAAAHQLGRICYTQELEPKYCQAIIDRMRLLDPEITIKKNGIEI